MTTAIHNGEIHIVRLAVHEAEDLADMLRIEARSGNARRYNQAMQGARWFEARMENRKRIEPLDLALRGNDWNRLASLCALHGLVGIARKIWIQIEVGD